jgi:protein phosphatase 2C
MTASSLHLHTLIFSVLLQAAGGHVWWDRVMGELAVSRAIGDHCLRPYVIPEPELLMVERTPDDEVLVMASDGLWDVMNSQEVVDMALHSLQVCNVVS